MRHTVDPIIDKRNNLERFVKEQILGPGAFNKRLMFIANWSSNDFKGKKLKECSAIDNRNEVISELPAYQYSSGILFPISKTAEEVADEQEASFDSESAENEAQDVMQKADDEEFNDDQEQSISSKNQNYPNTCGLSFAIGIGQKLESCLSIKISFRQYKKVRQEDCHNRKLSLWIEHYTEQISSIIASHFSEVFEMVQFDGNVFMSLLPGIDINQYLYSLDYINLDRLLRETVISLIQQRFPDKEFFRSATKTYNNIDYPIIILHEEALLDEIQKLLREDKGAFSDLKLLIENLEIYQQIKQYVNELKAIYRASSRRNLPTPIWESYYHEIDTKLEPFIEPVVQRGEVVLKEFPNLTISYQYFKESEAVYVKLILVNRAVIELRPNEPEQLNKKDRANELSLFGIKMVVSENTESSFRAYNPPNLLEIDEEDSFNKLLYRKFKDYAEGYNTSVTWGNLEDRPNLRFVATEFIPHQNTPSVDFKPSKLENENVVGLIDAELLSIRNLSTLTLRSDFDILNDLTTIVKTYTEWIIEKRKEIESEKEIVSGVEVLEKQIMACEKDRDRLFRNIELLRNDPKAIAAFRVMNTAMFMQLHHGLMIKKAKQSNIQSFIPSDSSSTFYQNVLLDKDYSWRSFQLAFILLNVDAFVRPDANDKTVTDVFGMSWPERNELADLVWFPTGGGKTEAYLGIIAFCIAYRRFSCNECDGKGTTVLMRYTLRLLTLQQFQRATLLVCALEAIRKDDFPLPGSLKLGSERITIGLFVGVGSLPNKWEDMRGLLSKISEQITENRIITTSLPHTECPWCGGALFTNSSLTNIHPGIKDQYGIGDKLTIMCNTNGCTFNARRPNENKSLPLRLFDEDIYKFPPTLLFGTVDKFASLANKIATDSKGRNQDSRRLLGKGYQYSCLPPELIIQDELHLLLGPLGSAVGLFEKCVDELCTYTLNGIKVRPKIITSTATTRNTDKQIFALFDRRCEIFPKQGIICDDSFFSFYKRNPDDVKEYSSNRRYLGLLPVGKTQVWMQLRVASICLAHRLKFMLDKMTLEDVFQNAEKFKYYLQAIDYYHTVLSYFNSLKEVGKTQSQLSHYLPGDLHLIIKNTIPWSLLSRIIKPSNEIDDSELTGRLSGEEVKSNLNKIEASWNLNKSTSPPEFVIATNMISVGIDVSRFNTMIINSMPRNTAEYIQASSRIARDREGLVFTVHHPFRSRDISHYQRFREFHEKFYSYVEPISVTPFANKALDRYFAMYLAAMIRHNEDLKLMNNDDANAVDMRKIDIIRQNIITLMHHIYERALKLNHYLRNRTSGIATSVEGIITEEELNDIALQLDDLLINRWLDRLTGQEPIATIKYRDELSKHSLFAPRKKEAVDNNWNVKESLREIAPLSVIKTVQQ